VVQRWCGVADIIEAGQLRQSAARLPVHLEELPPYTHQKRPARLPRAPGRLRDTRITVDLNDAVEGARRPAPVTRFPGSVSGTCSAGRVPLGAHPSLQGLRCTTCARQHDLCTRLLRRRNRARAISTATVLIRHDVFAQSISSIGLVSDFGIFPNVDGTSEG
jgi:hypothetical protein